MRGQSLFGDAETVRFDSRGLMSKPPLSRCDKQGHCRGGVEKKQAMQLHFGKAASMVWCRDTNAVIPAKACTRVPYVNLPEDSHCSPFEPSHGYSMRVFCPELRFAVSGMAEFSLFEFSPGPLHPLR